MNAFLDNIKTLSTSHFYYSLEGGPSAFNFKDPSAQNYFYALSEIKQCALLQFDFKVQDDLTYFLLGQAAPLSQRGFEIRQLQDAILALPGEGCLIFLNAIHAIKEYAANRDRATASFASLFSSTPLNDLALCNYVLENIRTKLIVLDVLEKINNAYQQLPDEKGREVRKEKLANLLKRINKSSNFLITSEKFNESVIAEIEKETGFGGGIGFGKLNDALKLLITHVKQKNITENERIILGVVLESRDTSPRV